MPAMRQCRGCGADVPNNAPFGHCPKCLLELGFGPLPEAPEAPPPAPAPAGARRFGDYELLDQIGRGGMGVIYKARQATLNRLVALKMIRAAEFASPMLIQRFHLEAEAAAGLHHPNIVPIYETGEHEGEHFFSMALVDGFGLDRYITSAGFWFDRKAGEEKPSVRARQEQIARLMAKVARAVDYAHQHGVLHRDLKPSNILLDRQGEPHLTDFGVAKVLGQSAISLTASGAIMGTPSYMAPEQAAGQSKRVTTAADIYSLGAILYEMLTGQPPFRAETPVETLKQVIEQEAKHPTTFKEGVDRDLATISMKCLEKEPQRRYNSAAALAEDLERWLGREPIHARPLNSAERAWRWCRRNPKVATLGGAVALLLVAVAVGATLFALRIKTLNDTIERNNRQLRTRVLDNLINVYSDPDTISYVIESDDRRALAGQVPARLVPGSPLHLTNAVYVYEHPTNMLDTFSPILDALEKNLSERLRRPVAIHLHIFKTYDAGYQALESDGLNFGRVGPASYLYLLDRSNGVRLLAMQDHKEPLTLAIFTHITNKIARLQDSRPAAPLSELLSKCSLALSHTNSTTGNHVPKFFLATNGIYFTNLGRIEHLAGQRRVIDAVRTGKFDVGAGNAELVEDYPELRVIARLEVKDLGLCWVAGKGLDVAIEKHLRQCLRELRDSAVLDKLESDVVGFKMMKADALERLRAIIRGAAAFDAGKN